MAVAPRVVCVFCRKEVPEDRLVEHEAQVHGIFTAPQVLAPGMGQEDLCRWLLHRVTEIGVQHGSTGCAAQDLLEEEHARRFVSNLWQAKGVKGLQRMVLSFHGTADKALASINQHGLVASRSQQAWKLQLPKGVDAYGPGIYTATDPTVAAGYASRRRSSGKLAVVLSAVFPGRLRPEVTNTAAARDVDSVAPGGSYLVLKQPAQVLPCFNLQLEPGEDASSLTATCLYQELSGMVRELNDFLGLGLDIDYEGTIRAGFPFMSGSSGGSGFGIWHRSPAPLAQTAHAAEPCR